ncbi:MAG: RimK/LysX family protein [Pseudomonadota bacterium]
MGWIEPVILIPWGVQFKAKLDSGAKTSSIHAKQVERFEKDGEPWVRFVIPVESKRKKRTGKMQVERPLVRDVRIKRHKTSSYARPVVSLEFCMNGQDYVTQFNLIDRSGFNYPVLLGRRFLKDVAVIDPAAVFLSDRAGGDCRKRYPDKWAKKKKS